MTWCTFFPKGNTCWSITRAYVVFLRQMNPADGLADSNSRKSSKRSKDKRQKPLISSDALTIQNKVTMKRRSDYQTTKTKRSKMEIEKSKRKVGDVSRKKSKDVAPMKHQITKHLKAKGREFKKAAKRNNTAKAIIRMKNRIDKGIVSSVRKRSVQKRAQKRSVQKRAARKPRENALLVRDSHQGADVYVPNEFGRSILTWLIDLGVVPENIKIVYMNHNGIEKLQEGLLTKKGIHCHCCKEILSVSKFEDHAGSNMRQPYQNIYINEASLLQFQIVALKNHGGSVCQRFVSVDTAGEDLNDDTCEICGDGGDLMCGDNCPSTFHLDCLGLQVGNYETRDEMAYGCSGITDFQRFIRLTKDEFFGFASTGDKSNSRRKFYDHRPLNMNDDDYQRVCQISKRKGACFRDLPGVIVGLNNVAEFDPNVERVPKYAMTFIDGKTLKPFGRLW